MTDLKDHPEYREREAWRSYAMAALTGLCAGSPDGPPRASTAAEIADLMLAQERKRYPRLKP